MTYWVLKNLFVKLIFACGCC